VTSYKSGDRIAVPIAVEVMIDGVLKIGELYQPGEGPTPVFLSPFLASSQAKMNRIAQMLAINELIMRGAR